jgi:hypothetical protein
MGCLECYGHANMQQAKRLHFGFDVNIMTVIVVVLDDDGEDNDGIYVIKVLTILRKQGIRYYRHYRYYEY